MSPDTDILFIAHRIPYPPDKGDKIRSYHMLRHLAPRYRITVACMIDDPGDLSHVAPLEDMVDRVFYQLRTPNTMKARAILSLLTGLPFTLSCFYARSLQAEIDAWLDHHTPRAVVCFCAASAEYVFRSRHYPGKLQEPVLLADLVDVDSEKWRQYGEKQGGLKKWLFYREARKLLPFEQQVVDVFDHSFLVTEEECQVFARLGGGGRVEALANGVDLDYFSPRSLPQTGEGRRLVFSGAMDYWPNVEGALWFVDQVFPSIRRQEPSATFVIAGRNPDEKLRKLAGKPGIEVTGTVPDMRDCLEAADICVAPLLIARGIQNKVLEGMAMQKPVVSTSGAATGLHGATTDEILVADDPGKMAEMIIDLIRDPERRVNLGRAARAYVEREHSWAAHLGRLSDLIEAGKKA